MFLKIHMSKTKIISSNETFFFLSIPINGTTIVAVPKTQNILLRVSLSFLTAYSGNHQIQLNLLL